MTNWTCGLCRFVTSEDGGTTAEYAVLLALLILVYVTAVSELAESACCMPHGR